MTQKMLMKEMISYDELFLFLISLLYSVKVISFLQLQKYISLFQSFHIQHFCFCFYFFKSGMTGYLSSLYVLAVHTKVLLPSFLDLRLRKNCKVHKDNYLNRLFYLTFWKMRMLSICLMQIH